MFGVLGFKLHHTNGISYVKPAGNGVGGHECLVSEGSDGSDHGPF
jgi:hypothetical protein